MRDRDLASLIRAGQRGDRDALTELVRRFERPVYAYLVRMAPDLAEDACQETFLRLFRSLPRYRHRGRFRPWLFRLATNALIDALRRRRRTGERALPEAAVDPAPDPAEALVHKEQVRRLADALGDLPFEQRQVVALRTRAGLTFREIAEALDCPIGTVLARMHRAVKALRGRLRQ